MIVKGIIDEDFVNYKKPSMVIMFPSCSWKCEKDCGKRVCQNGALANSPNIEIEPEEIVKRYMNNPLTSAIVIAGLEPFDDYKDLMELIGYFRALQCTDDIVIYSGYTESELKGNYSLFDLQKYSPIIVKVGRFIPNKQERYDDTLGVKLASDNQYSIRI